MLVRDKLSESEQEQWSKKVGKSKDWVVWCRSRKKDQEQYPFEADGKEILSNRSKQANPKAGENTNKKGGKGQSVRWKVWWQKSNIKCAVSEEYALCWVNQDCHMADLKKAARVSGGKDKCQVRLKGRERDYWMGMEIGMIGGCGFQGQIQQATVQTKKANLEQDIIN